MTQSNDSAKLMAQPLNELRERINALDSQLLTLISERAGLAQQVAEAKLSEDPNAVFYRPEREAQVMRRIMALNQGPLDDAEMARLFREIMSSCLALERPLTVAYLGPEGTFSQQAMLKQFGGAVDGVPVASIQDVFRQVESKAVDYGVVPIENSTEGAVNQTLDAFMTSGVRVCGDVFLPIHHNLLAHEDAHSLPISRIYSHPQSLAQCRGWLMAHHPNAELIAVTSNAEAVRRAEEEPGTAAIAGEQVMDYFDVSLLARRIEDLSSNVTHFLVIGREAVGPSGNDRTLLLATLHNQPGALEHLLEPLSRQGIDIIHLDSRPSRTEPWHYVFFVEVTGHCDDGALAQALQELHDTMIDIRVLGSWPAAVI